MGTQADNLIKFIEERGKNLTRSRTLSFASGKGGVGKTAISVSLSYVLANNFGKRVLLLDCDVGLGNVHVLLGLRPERNLKAVLEGKDIHSVIQTVHNFDVVLGFSGIESLDELDNALAANLFYQLDRIIGNYDYVILDNSAGLGRFTVNISRLSSATYVVTTPEPTALTDAYAFIKSMFKLFNYRNFRVVVNMCRSRSEGFETFSRLNQSTRNFLGIPLKLAGILPFSKSFKTSLMSRELVVAEKPSDAFTLEIKKIAQIETGEKLEENEGFLSRLLRMIKNGA